VAAAVSDPSQSTRKPGLDETDDVWRRRLSVVGVSRPDPTQRPHIHWGADIGPTGSLFNVQSDIKGPWCTDSSSLRSASVVRPLRGPKRDRILIDLAPFSFAQPVQCSVRSAPSPVAGHHPRHLVTDGLVVMSPGVAFGAHPIGAPSAVCPSPCSWLCSVRSALLP